MKSIMFFCIPAHGHHNPTFPVVKELVNRGNTVRFYSFNEFKEKPGRKDDHSHCAPHLDDPECRYHYGVRGRHCRRDWKSRFPYGKTRDLLRYV